MTKPGSRPARGRAGPDAHRVHDQATLATELQLLRRRASLGTGRPTVTLSDLAARVNLPRSTVHNYVTGRSLTPADVLDQIVIALGATPAEQREWGEAWFRVAAALEEQHRGRPAPVPVPRQLPPDTSPFTGRASQLTRLSAQLAMSGRPACVVLSGPAGAGKTSLAVHWARQVADRFPDGQLYANLGGFGPGSPAEPGQVLAQFLGAFGVPASEVPPGTEARAAALRSLLAGRQVLMVLDNARNADQVRPLVPGNPECLALVTSRNRLRGLSVRDSAHRITVGPLTEQEAHGLLRMLAGAGLAEREPAALLEAARWCGGLPLALRIVGDRLSGEEDGDAAASALAEVTAELRSAGSRLDVLRTDDDPSTSLSTVFSWSYRALSQPAASLFRMLGLHPGPDIGRPAAAALLGLHEPEIRAALDSLSEGHLLEPRPARRYELHDLVRTYAARLTGVTDSETARREAVGRLLDHYLATSSAAAELLGPEDRSQQPATPPAAAASSPFAGRGQAAAWLDGDLPNLVATSELAIRDGWPEYARALSTVLRRYLRMSAQHDAAQRIHAHALTAARQLRDRAGEGQVHADLAIICWQSGRFGESIEHLENSLAIARETGDRVTEGRALGSLGVVYTRAGRYRDAAENFQHSLAIAQATGVRRTESADLNNLGVVQQRLGRYREAMSTHHVALTSARETGNRPIEAFALLNLGDTSRLMGRYPEAFHHLRQALSLSRTAGIREAEGYALAYLGLVRRCQKAYQEALAHQLSALHIARETGMRALEASVLNGLGETHTSAGDAASAKACHDEALLLARITKDRYEQAQALGGLAAALRDLGDADEARIYSAQARSIHAELGTPPAQANLPGPTPTAQNT